LSECLRNLTNPPIEQSERWPVHELADCELVYVSGNLVWCVDKMYQTVWTKQSLQLQRTDASLYANWGLL